MAADSWSRFAAASGRPQNALHSRFAADLYMGFEEADGGEDESRAEFPCPFCSEEFDIVELCGHIDDEHPVEAKNGVCLCPICEDRVGVDMVGHITMQHGNFFKGCPTAESGGSCYCRVWRGSIVWSLTPAFCREVVSNFEPMTSRSQWSTHMQRTRRSRKSSGSHYTLSLLKKELREGHIQALLGGSCYTVPPNAAPDPLLSSFIYNFPIVDPVKVVQPQASDEESALSKILDSKSVESIEPPLSDKDHEEKARRSEFVGELMLSTIFEDRL